MHYRHPPHQKYDLTSFKDFLNCDQLKNDNYIGRPMHTFLDTDLTVIKVIKLENISNEWSSLLNQIELPFCDLRTKNRSKTKDHIFTQDDYKIIEKIYAEDFNLFSYELISDM